MENIIIKKLLKNKSTFLLHNFLLLLSALPCSRCSGTNTSTDANTTEVHHHVQKLGETEKALLSSVFDKAKNATSYINQNFHEMTHLEEVEEPPEARRLKKATKLNKTKAANEVKNNFNTTKIIIENDLKNSTNSFKNDTKQVQIAKNNLDCEKNCAETIENPVKNSIENDKKVSVPRNYSEVDINKTEIIIEDNLKNTTKSEKGVYLKNSSEELSIAQNLFEVDQNNNGIIYHHHNPSNAPALARTKRNASKPITPRRYLPTIRKGRTGENDTDSDNYYDTRYMLVHDVPVFRRKRSYDNDEHQEACDHHKAKNITIIIQNFLNDLGDDPSTTPPNPTSNKVSFLHRTKRSSYFQQDKNVHQPEAEDGYSENSIELKDGVEKPKDFVDSKEDADKNDATASAVKKDSDPETDKWKMRYRYYENIYQGPVPVAETKVKVLKRKYDSSLFIINSKLL